ncbi:MAG: ABC transporter ATP-binding protein [Microgenomates group bacterium]
MIYLHQVSKKFADKIAVDKISFKAKEGEIIGFVGPNGAGKTTTMRLILGYLKPTEGEIKVDGADPIKERIKVLEKVGYLPENNPLYQEMKVAEYLQFIAQLKKENNSQEIISQVGLDEVLSQKIEELSRGFKQRVGLAAALFGNPKILILDEPTSGLDPLEQGKIRAFIKKQAKKKTIIFSTHILSEVEDIANRLIIINKGRIVYDGVKPKGRGGVEKLFKKVVK